MCCACAACCRYDVKRHTPAYGWNTGIGGDTAEYDVPKCPEGTPVEKCTHEITGVVTVPGDKMHFVGAHYHCHAPTCLKMEIYNNATGELICAEETYHGQGNNINKGAAKGTDRFDEEGYIAQRVCLWGNSTYGLEKPPLMSGTKIFIRAITNSTNGHHGEMVSSCSRTLHTFCICLCVRARFSLSLSLARARALSFPCLRHFFAYPHLFTAFLLYRRCRRCSWQTCEA